MADTEVLQGSQVQEMIDNALKATVNSLVLGLRIFEASALAMTASTFGTSAPDSYTSAATGISEITLTATTSTSTADTHPGASARAPKDKYSGKYRTILQGFSGCM